MAGWSSSGLSGNKRTPGLGGYDWWLIKVDGSGNRQWERVYGGTGDEYLYSVAPGGDGGWLLGGYSASGISGNKGLAGFNNNDYWIVKVDASGTKQWEQVFGGGYWDTIYTVQSIGDGSFLLGGSSTWGAGFGGAGGNKETPGFAGTDYWLIKLPVVEVPVGTPQVKANGKYSGSGAHVAGDSAQITITTSFASGQIFYTLDGSAPSFGSTMYAGQFTVTQSCTVRAIAYSSDFSQSAEADPVTVTILPTYALTVSTPGGGSVSVDPPTGPYMSNTVVTVTATASSGWTFMYWTNDASLDFHGKELN